MSNIPSRRNDESLTKKSPNQSIRDTDMPQKQINETKENNWTNEDDSVQNIMLSCTFGNDDSIGCRNKDEFLVQKKSISFLQQQIPREKHSEKPQQQHSQVVEGGSEVNNGNNFICEESIDDTTDRCQAYECDGDDGTLIGLKSDGLDGNVFSTDTATRIDQSFNGITDSEDKKEPSQEDSTLESKETPTNSKNDDSRDEDTGPKEQTCPENNDSLQDEGKSNGEFFTSQNSMLLLQGESDAVDKQEDNTASFHPLDGLWEMRWESYPIETTTFIVHEHKFEMFEHPCELKLGGPKDEFCPSFQWPVAITSVENQTFQKSNISIPPNTNSKKWPTSIEWTVTDRGYGVSTWTKLNSTEGKSELVDDQNNDTTTSYALDGAWEMRWKSKFNPDNMTTLLVSKHKFQVFGSPCEIKLGGLNDNYCPRLQFLDTKNKTTGLNKICATSKIAVLPITSEDLTNSIDWTFMYPPFGEVTWTRSNSKHRAARHCLLQVQNDGTASKQSDIQEKQIDDTPSLYLLDGRWELSWKGYPANTTTFVVHQHSFSLLGCSCKLELGDPKDSYYYPIFQWPVAITSIENPVFQQSKIPVPPSKNSKEWPVSIEWITTDPFYGNVTWRRLDSTSAIESNVHEQKKCNLSTDEIYASVVKKRQPEYLSMASTTPILGKAWNLVEGALALQTDDIKIIGRDDIIFLAERLLKAQMDYKDKGIPCRVDIAYHHTRSENLFTIKTDGLLSRSEREEKNIHSHFNGSAYGDGIYCSLDPTTHANKRYGDTVLLLARMKGIDAFDRYSSGFNTLTRKGFCVLQHCNQCVPLFRFKSILLRNDDMFRNSQHRYGNFLEILKGFHKKTQILLDTVLNENVATLSKNHPMWLFQDVPIPYHRKTRRSTIRVTKRGIPMIMQETIPYAAPERLAVDFCNRGLTYHLELSTDCKICTGPLTMGNTVQIAKCGHLFHRECVEASMKMQSCCPVCCVPISYKHWRGTMPSGYMTVSQDSVSCAGFQLTNTIVIHYEIPQGIQKKYHPSPGEYHELADFKAYIPSTSKGHALLTRLIFAFSRGLVFSVGTCALTGCRNSVILAVSHQIDRSTYDRFYIPRANEELSRLHVPSAKDICKMPQLSQQLLRFCMNRHRFGLV